MRKGGSEGMWEGGREGREGREGRGGEGREGVYKYVRYNTANNVSNCGGDPVTQLIFNVYQMIKL